jgi:hypothetical protein
VIQLNDMGSQHVPWRARGFWRSLTIMRRAWYDGHVAGVDESIRELLKLPLEDRAHAAKLLLDTAR